MIHDALVHQSLIEEHWYWIQEQNREKEGGGKTSAPTLDPQSQPVTWEEFGFKDPWSYYQKFLPSKGWDKRAEGKY